MQQLKEIMISDHFKKDVLAGLLKTQKKLPSKYFYDKTGDSLFQKIMEMPEYYLTKCELDIFENKTSALANLIVPKNEPFDLIELGAGDAVKSTFLLKHLIERNFDFTYMPIDISGNILNVLETNLSQKLPELNIQCLEGEYFEMLKKATSYSKRKKVVLFLGSNIGNMEMNEAQEFCISLKENLSAGDVVVIGFDLKKNPHTILNAYNDQQGITAEFNLNLLKRINRELNADFNLKSFEHYQTYDPKTGACRSFLVSMKHQQVKIDNELIVFGENELIDMEISQKFSHQDIQEICERSGFKIIGEISDSKNWFLDSAWKII